MLLPSTQLRRGGLQLCPHTELSGRRKSGLKHTAPLGLLLFIHFLDCCSKYLYRTLEDLSFLLQGQVGWKLAEESSASSLIFPNPTTAQEGYEPDSSSAIQRIQYVSKSPGRRGACLVWSLEMWSLAEKEWLNPPDYWLRQTYTHWSAYQKSNTPFALSSLRKVMCHMNSHAWVGVR